MSLESLAPGSKVAAPPWHERFVYKFATTSLCRRAK